MSYGTRRGARIAKSAFSRTVLARADHRLRERTPESLGVERLWSGWLQQLARKKWWRRDRGKHEVSSQTRPDCHSQLRERRAVDSSGDGRDNAPVRCDSEQRA